ncbi:MAG: alpha/beta fold hydrolase [Planctomycetota bacterium]|nr:MAG: alpha/beta fold hydrolase [Planctomycetota bacterium]
MNALLHERVTIPAHELGDLTGELCYPAAGRPDIAVLIAGPHPYMGGTMKNPLIVALAERIARENAVCLRFDYGRPAGGGDALAASMSAFWATGRAPEDPRRFDEVRAATRFARRLGIDRLAVVGYSFGGACAWQVAAETPPDSLVLISPTLTKHEFARVASDAAPPRLLVLHAANDFSTPIDVVRDWAASQPRRPELRVFPEGDHFFRGSEAEVAEVVASFLTRGAPVASTMEAPKC